MVMSIVRSIFAVPLSIVASADLRIAAGVASIVTCSPLEPPQALNNTTTRPQRAADFTLCMSSSPVAPRYRPSQAASVSVMARINVPEGEGGDAVQIWTLRPEMGAAVAKLSDAAYNKSILPTRVR